MHKIDNTYLTLEKLHEIVHEQQAIELSQDATKRILDCRSFFCLLYTSPSPRDGLLSRMPSSA